jgi:large subunit ribosomal protein L22
VTGPKTNEREGTRAVLRNTRTSAYKIREVLDLIRGLPVGEARDILRFSERDAAALVLKLLNSAVANAENNDHMLGDELYVSACYADEGRTYKTFRPRARGRAGRLRKRTAHITVIVSRLPEGRLRVVKAKQERAEADRRSRRVAASQKQEGRGRRRRGRGGDATAAPGAATTAGDEGIVDQQAAALDQVDQDDTDTGSEAGAGTTAAEAAAGAEAESTEVDAGSGGTTQQAAAAEDEEK